MEEDSANSGDARVCVERVCTKCGYDLAGLRFDGVCPECGLAVRESAAPAAEAIHGPARDAMMLGVLALVLSLMCIGVPLGLPAAVLSLRCAAQSRRLTGRDGYALAANTALIGQVCAALAIVISVLWFLSVMRAGLLW